MLKATAKKKNEFSNKLSPAWPTGSGTSCTVYLCNFFGSVWVLFNTVGLRSKNPLTLNKTSYQNVYVRLKLMRWWYCTLTAVCPIPLGTSPSFHSLFHPQSILYFNISPLKYLPKLKPHCNIPRFHSVFSLLSTSDSVLPSPHRISTPVYNGILSGLNNRIGWRVFF